MATSNASSEQALAQVQDFRNTAAAIVAEIRSQEIRDTYAAITLTEVLNQQLAALTGTSRIPSRKQRLQKNYDAFNASLEAIKSTSPDAFRTPDKDSDVNTPR